MQARLQRSCLVGHHLHRLICVSGNADAEVALELPGVPAFLSGDEEEDGSDEWFAQVISAPRDAICQLDDTCFIDADA
jgi:hypothetical protein